MKGAIYTRFSTEFQQSTQMQIDQCRAYAVKHSIEVVAIYSDEGTTGTNTSRGDFQHLVFDAQNGFFDAVIIYDVTRGSRDVADWFNFRKLMSSFNVKVFSTTEELGDILDPDNYLKELITVGIGQHQVLQTRKKSIDGKTTQARLGLFQGGFAPLGFDIVNQEYHINEREAEAVKLIYSMYAAGESYNAIIDLLANRGFRGKRGRPIGKNSLYSILRNDRYIGVYSWNRDIKRQMHHWVGLKNQNPNKVEIENIIPRIVDEDTWNKVRLRMTNSTKGKNKAIEPFLLSGKIVCDECGERYVGHTSTNSRGVKTRYYVCGNKYRTRSCKARNLNADVLEAELKLHMEAWLSTVNPEEYADAVAEAWAKASKVDRKSLAAEKIELETKIRNGSKIMLQNPELSSILDEMLLMQTRLTEIDSILSSVNAPMQDILDHDTLVAILLRDMGRINEMSAQELFGRYLKEVHVLNGEISIIGGVFRDGANREIIATTENSKKDDNDIVLKDGSPSRI